MSTPRYSIQPVRPEDVPAVVAMVHELAEYERSSQECRVTEPQMSTALFGSTPVLCGHLAFSESGLPVAMMLWFLNFSTWEGVPGIYLEDLYVRPVARGHGLGKQMLAALASVCVERGYPRLDWWVLNWNPAREFYHALGAVAMDEWVPYRLTGGALNDLGLGRGAGRVPGNVADSRATPAGTRP